MGYRVAGKTGTAHKLDGEPTPGDRYVSSFVDIAPASAPRLLVAVMIDEPSAGQYYGGEVAAPVFSRSCRKRCACCRPARCTDHRVVPLEAVPEVREEV